MGNVAALERNNEEKTQPISKENSYYSVEFSINGGESYLFKLWYIPSMSMCVLVKEGSALLPQLEVGNTFKMKYYSTDTICTCEYKETAIRNIIKNDEGPFRGHYLVGLELVGSPESVEAKPSH